MSTDRMAGLEAECKRLSARCAELDAARAAAELRAKAAEAVLRRSVEWFGVPERDEPRWMTEARAIVGGKEVGRGH